MPVALILTAVSALLLPGTVVSEVPLLPPVLAPSTVVAAPDKAGGTVELPLTGVDPTALSDLPRTGPVPDDASPQALRSAEAAPTTPDVLTPELDTAAYSVLGLTWDHAGATPDDVVVRYRVRQAGTWSAWEATAASDLAPDPGTVEAARSQGRSSTDAIVALHADGLQVWAQSAGGAVHGLEAVLIDPGTRSADAAPTATTRAVAAVNGPPAPAIIPRSGWGANESLRTCQPDLSTEVVAAAVHHTASTTSYSAADVPALIRGFYAYHTRPEAQGGRGWCDIGYNFLVDQFGRVWEGRAGGIDVDVVGVHTGGFNSRTFAVSAIGSYGTVAPTPAMTEAISRTIAWKFAMHRISASATVTMISGGGASKYPAGTAVVFHTIFGHRDAQQTSCPGQLLYNQLAAIRTRVSALSDAALRGTPLGSWDGHATTSTSLSVGGWALDLDTSASLTVRVAVDGVEHKVVADIDRPDVEKVYPGHGSRHGFALTIRAASGRHAVCVRVTNVGDGADRLLGCRWMNVRNAPPTGQLDSVKLGVGTATVSGWALDPDTEAPIAVHVYVDSRGTQASANRERPDLARYYSTTDHGYQVTVPFPAGKHRLCVYGINVPAGTNPALGCRDLTMPDKPPVGQVDSVKLGVGTATVSGWALDPDTTNPIAVHVYVDSTGTQTSANRERPDLARYYSTTNHGYQVTVQVPSGRHRICVYAIDVPVGNNPVLSCRDVTMPDKPPVGQLDSVSVRGTVATVSGWAVDPDTTNPIAVHVYVGTRGTAGRADLERPDLGPYFSTTNHGYRMSVYLPAGTHQLCVYAIDVPVGNNPALGCRTLTR